MSAGGGLSRPAAERWLAGGTDSGRPGSLDALSVPDALVGLVAVRLGPRRLTPSRMHFLGLLRLALFEVAV